MQADPAAATPNEAPRRRWPRWQRWLLGLLAAGIGLVLLAWLALPPLLQAQLERRGSAELGRTVSIGDLRFDREPALGFAEIDLASDLPCPRAAPWLGHWQPPP